MEPAGTDSRLVPLAGNLHAIPMQCGVLAWAVSARRALAAYRPDAIIVEYPAALQGAVEQLAAELPRIAVLGWRTEPGTAWMIPGDPCDARMEGVRVALETGVPLHCIDTLNCGAQEPEPIIPDGALTEVLGAARLAESLLEGLPPVIPVERDRVLAGRLREIAEQYERPVYIGSIHRMDALRQLLRNPSARLETPEVENEPRWELFPVGGRRLGLTLSEIPWVAWLWENFRSSRAPEDPFDPSETLESLYRRAATTYAAEYHEEVNLTEWRAIRQYARNLAMVRGRIRPRLYEATMAAKSCVDGDFGAIVLQQALDYPPNNPDADDAEDLSTHASLSLHGEFDGDQERLEHAYGASKFQELTFQFHRRPRPTSLQKAQWRDSFFGGMDGICSWPPEDDFIEKFFRTIRQRAFQAISDNHSTSEEFTSSALDGLDVRETVRNWHRGKLYVRRERIPPGKIGPVVLYWRDLPFLMNGVWRSTLYAENQNESDISIYSTTPGQEMVGPGITRVDYFGILSVYPACHIPDVWSAGSFAAHVFSRLSGEPTHARVLMAAALVLSEERYVAIVGPQPPDSGIRQLARQLGRAIIYLPLATFSKTLLKRARQSHILSGHQVRSWAGDYIPEL